MHSLGISIAAILLLGIGAQWIAWRIRLPAILLLLVFGLAAGPATGFLHPDQIFGIDLLLQIVQFSVAIILFEGGMSLNLEEVRRTGGTVLSLVSIGMLVSWAVSTAAAHLILKFDLQLSALIGALLVVTGPTVIGPMLRLVRPTKTVGSILKWEGIMIDPVGVIFAVILFEALFGQHGTTPNEVISSLFRTAVIGLGLGVGLAGILTFLLRKFWIPEFLQSPFTLMVVIGSFAISNMWQPESGLLTVTILGLALANQRFARVEHIFKFKENLQVLLISSLFILLGARIQPETLAKIGSQSFFFLMVLIVVGRPLSVWLSTLFSPISLREKTFLALIAPRGIVAAAAAALFAVRLEEVNHPDAALFVPNVFFVVMGSVLLYGIAALPLARKLQVTDANPQGVLIIGASEFPRALARALTDRGYATLLVDTNFENTSLARGIGLNVIHGNVLTDKALESAELQGIGKVFAMTPNNEVNSLALVKLQSQFTAERSYHSAPSESTRGRLSEKPSVELQGRVLFGGEWDIDALNALIRSGGVVRATTLTEKFSQDEYEARYGKQAIILAVENSRKILEPVTHDYFPRLRPGTTVIALIPPDVVAEKPGENEQKSQGGTDSIGTA